MKLFIKRPLFWRNIGRRSTIKFHAIEVPYQQPLRFVDGKQMIPIREIHPLEQIHRTTRILVVRPSISIMYGSVVGSGFVTHIFHNINFATLGPIAVEFFRGEHPKRGPQTSADWDADSSFEITVPKIGLIFCTNSSRCVLLSVSDGLRFFSCVNGEFAIGNVNIVRLIPLKLVVAPTTEGATVANLVGPFIRRVEFVAVKFIRPSNTWTHVRVSGCTAR
mmetsp:Transcript_17136/g.20978  ORF Transcript_17136/g.20978 Transcript_17136/m.20978 type:complete len:220 (+) Transcript_17136:521-1180(+)